MYVVVFIAVTTILLCGSMASIWIVDASRYYHSIPSLCGTWRGEHNNLVIFNSNGTGRGYVNVHDPQRSTFIRWGQNDKELNVYFERKNKGLFQMIEQARRGLPACQHFHYAIQSVTENELVITDPSTDNQVLTFRRIADYDVADGNDRDRR